jgi:hypothetical protein
MTLYVIKEFSMNTIKRLALLALIACAYSTATTAANDSYDANATFSSDNFESIAQATNLVSKYFFSKDLQVTPAAKQLAYLTHEVSFIQLNGDAISICRFDYLRGNATLTKYRKDGSDLIPVRSEQYNGAADGGSRCIRKGKNARSVKLQEKIARGFRATVKADQITQVKFLDLYNSFVPMWIQAGSAEDIRSFIDCVKDDLTTAAIDPSVRTQDGKPLCIITLKNDLFLDTINPALWRDLRSAYNMTTFADSELRKYIWNTKTALADTIQGASDEVFPSFWAELFEDLSKENYGFSFKKGARKILSEILSVKHITMFIAAVVGFNLIQWSGKKINNKITTGHWSTKKPTMHELVEQRVQDLRIKHSAKQILQKELSAAAAGAAAAGGTA